jgi:hypothetical protein
VVRGRAGWAAVTSLPAVLSKLSGFSISTCRPGSHRAQCCRAISPYRFMVAPLVRHQVSAGEQRILHEFVLEVTGLARPARGTTGPG